MSVKRPTFPCVKCERKKPESGMEYTFPVPICSECWHNSALAPRKPSEPRLHKVHILVAGKPFSTVTHLAWDARETMAWAKVYLYAETIEVLGMLGLKGDVTFSVEGLETQLSIEDEIAARGPEDEERMRAALAILQEASNVLA